MLKTREEFNLRIKGREREDQELDVGGGLVINCSKDRKRNRRA